VFIVSDFTDRRDIILLGGITLKSTAAAAAAAAAIFNLQYVTTNQLKKIFNSSDHAIWTV